MGNLRDAIDQDLVAMLIASKDMKGRELDDLMEAMPPEQVRKAILTDTDTDEAAFWYNEQRDWQRRAKQVIQRLEPPTREMALADELPSWMGETWAKFLFLEWSHRLGWAVEQAEEWLATTGA